MHLCTYAHTLHTVHAHTHTLRTHILCACTHTQQACAHAYIHTTFACVKKFSHFCISCYTSAVLDPLTDPTVRTEVTPSQSHRVPSHPFPLQLACTSAPPTSQLLTPSIPSATSTPFGVSEQGSPSTVLSPVFQTYQPVLVLHTEAPSAGCVQRNPLQAVCSTRLRT